jgi:hypothetical protein
VIKIRVRSGVKATLEGGVWRCKDPTTLVALNFMMFDPGPVPDAERRIAQRALSVLGGEVLYEEHDPAVPDRVY